MNIELGAHWEAFISERVRSGRYPSAGDVLLDGLRLIEENERIRALREEEFRKQLAQGLADLDRGDYIELDDAGMRRYIEDLDRRGKERLANRATPSAS